MTSARRSPGLVFLLLAAASVAALSQAPLLKLSNPSKSAHGWTVLLTNTYSSPVTAYALRFDNGVKWDDSIPGDIGLRPQLPPGASAAITVPSSDVAPPGLRNTAVIYADGASAGDPAVVARFLSIRTFFLGEIPAELARMRAVAADPGADRATLVSHYQAMAAANLPTLQQGLPGPISDIVSESVAATLSDPGNHDLHSTASVLAGLLSRWELQLESSRPKLKSAAIPPPS